MKLCRFISLSLLLLSANGLQAQTIADAEQHISYCLDAVSYWRFNYNAGDTTFASSVSPTDSIRFYNNSLEQYLVNNCARIPQLLTGNINLPENSDMSVVTADDKKLRIYSWDSHDGNNQSNWKAVAIYRANGKVVANSLNDVDATMKGDHKAIYAIKSADNKNYYLAVYNIPTPDKPTSLAGVTAYTIDKGKFSLATIFVSDKGTSSNIHYAYDYYANYSYDKMQELHTIHLSKNKKKLYIPKANGTILSGDDEVYVFDGEKFGYNKNAK